MMMQYNTGCLSFFLLPYETIEKDFRHLSIEDQTYVERLQYSLANMKKENQTLKSTINRYNTIVDAVQAFIYTKNKDLVFTYVNADYLAFLRVEHSIVGKNNFSAFSLEEADELDKLEKQVLEGNHIRNIEINIPGERGAKGLFSGRPILEEGTSKIIGITVAIEDVTERINASDKYKMLEAAVNASKDVFLIKKEGLGKTFEYISNAVKNLSGYEKKVFFSNPTFWINKVVHPADRERVCSYYRAKDSVFAYCVQDTN